MVTFGLTLMVTVTKIGNSRRMVTVTNTTMSSFGSDISKTRRPPSGQTLLLSPFRTQQTLQPP